MNKLGRPSGQFVSKALKIYKILADRYFHPLEITKTELSKRMGCTTRQIQKYMSFLREVGLCEFEQNNKAFNGRVISEVRLVSISGHEDKYSKLNFSDFERLKTGKWTVHEILNSRQKKEEIAAKKYAKEEAYELELVKYLDSKPYMQRMIKSGED